MEKVDFTVFDKRTNFRTLVQDHLRVFHYAGKDFLIFLYCHSFNLAKDSTVSLVCKSFTSFDDKSPLYLYISGDVPSDKILSCLITRDKSKAFDLYLKNCVGYL